MEVLDGCADVGRGGQVQCLGQVDEPATSISAYERLPAVSLALPVLPLRSSPHEPEGRSSKPARNIFAALREWPKNVRPLAVRLSRLPP